MKLKKRIICAAIAIMLLGCSGWSERDGKWVYYKDGSLVKDNWVNYEGEYYYFNNRGTMMHDLWVRWEGADYYLDSSGKMLKNTTTPDGYIVGEDGKAINKNTESLQETKNNFTTQTEYIRNNEYIQFDCPSNWVKQADTRRDIFGGFEKTIVYADTAGSRGIVISVSTGKKVEDFKSAKNVFDEAIGAIGKPEVFEKKYETITRNGTIYNMTFYRLEQGLKHLLNSFHMIHC